MIEYFQSYEGYFWQWEENGAVIAIPHSVTIAYKDFVMEVLEHLSAQGIPPFGSLLLAIIATNSQGETALNDVYALLDRKLEGRNSEREPLTSALAFLKLVAQLPKQYKEGKNRLLLLQTLFANSHNSLSATTARHTLDAFKRTALIGLGVKTTAFHMGVYNKEFRVISILQKRFPDTKAIINKLAGLVDVETPLALEESLVEEAPKDFIEELAANSKTFPIGSLVKHLWSGLHIPYHNYLPSQQPIGGVSDLTNKGEFDRLLISEYANEDLVFLSRLANNEALYINREVPPQQNDQERIILIDVSIRNWGTPKTLAYAVLLAIAKHPKSNFSCSAFAVGATCRPLAFDTVDAVIAGLEELDPCGHPAAGLTAFFKEYSIKRKAEIFFISAADSFRHPQLHKAISDDYALFNYWIQVDNEGAIDLYKRQQASRKHLQHLQLPLEALWKKEPVPAVNHTVHDSVSTYPILFRAPQNYKKVTLASDGRLFMLTAEKSILRSFNKANKHEKGWELVYENVVYNNGEIAVGIVDGAYLFFLFNTADRCVTMINMATGVKRTTTFKDWRSSEYHQFFFHEGRFYYVTTHRYWTFEWGEEIVTQASAHTPPELFDIYKDQEAGNKRAQANVYITGTILKNVNFVFINETGNLVLNKQELRLTDHASIILERTGFLKKEWEAHCVGKNKFQFPDGSSVTIHRCGMLLLKSSDPAIPTIYVPSVLDASLGVATPTDFAGAAYYQLPIPSQSAISNKQFWSLYMEPFINTIKTHGTSPKAH